MMCCEFTNHMNTPKHHRLALGLLCSSLLWAPQVIASTSIEADLDQLMPLSLMELINIPVVTASRQYETRDQTPAHILVITRQQIRERRYKNLADLMEDLPGVDFKLVPLADSLTEAAQSVVKAAKG